VGVLKNPVNDAQASPAAARWIEVTQRGHVAARTREFSAVLVAEPERRCARHLLRGPRFAGQGRNLLPVDTEIRAEDGADQERRPGQFLNRLSTLKNGIASSSSMPAATTRSPVSRSWARTAGA
jgi:hypothetical protein